MLGLSQATYINTVLVRFSLQNFKKGFVHFSVGKSLSGNQHTKTHIEIMRMRGISYASAVESLMYTMLRTRPDIYFVVGMVSRYLSDPSEEYWTTLKHIFKYLLRLYASLP